MKYIKTFESSNYKFFNHLGEFFNQIINKENDNRVHVSTNYVAITNKFGINILLIQSWKFNIDYYSFILDSNYPYLRKYLKNRILTNKNGFDNNVINFKEMNKPENLSKINIDDYKDFIDMNEKSKKYNL